MREILFRGKRINRGYWVYGYLEKQFGVNGTISSYPTDDREEWAISYHNDENERRYVSQVIPETVGEFTGFTDKNGKKIFEGDIVKTKYFGKLSANGQANFADYDIFEISYDNGGFCIENELRQFSLRILDNSSWLEVIGNIHDNPKLIGGDKNA